MNPDLPERRIIGPTGALVFPASDEITPRLMMLVEGQGLGAAGAALEHGVTRQRYYQRLRRLGQHDASTLQPQKRGSKTNYVRTDEIERV